MIYWKNKNDNGAVCISTLNADGEGNITETEYNEIRALLRAIPEGKMLIETASGYEYADIPEPPEEDITPEEAIEILLGVSE